MLTSKLMLHDFTPGDFLIFQLESGYALLRVLDVDTRAEIWHVAAYKDYFLDPEIADAALETPDNLAVERAHIALTNHAFESTQVARLRNITLNENDLAGYRSWNSSEAKEVHDRSIRLLLGLR